MSTPEHRVAAFRHPRGRSAQAKRGAVWVGVVILVLGLAGAQVMGGMGRAARKVWKLMRVAKNTAAAIALARPALPAAPGKNIYVDPRLPSDCPGAYHPEERSCGTGQAAGYASLERAGRAAAPGQIVLLRGGTYQEALVPARSGLPGQPITFANFPGEEPMITGAGLEPAIDLSGRTHLVIEGLRVQGVRRWMYAIRAHHNVVRNNTFLGARDPHGSSKTGLFFQDATHNKVLGNRIEDSTADNLSLVRSDRNVIQENTFLKAAHALWTIKCGNFNILRGNYFHNERQKIGEIYDCYRAGFDHDIRAQNATKYNLVEHNAFAYVPSSGNRSPYAGIQYAGQNGIIRYNRFHDTVGPGLDLTLYEKEALYTTDNQVYHNVFYATAFAGVAIARGNTLSGNVLKNNILARSRFVANDRRWRWYVGELDGKYVQVLTGRLDGFLFGGNVFWGGAGNDELYLITHGARNSGTKRAQHSVAWWQANHPHLFQENLELEPRFVDEDKRDFRLREGSGAIDAGVFLTRTTRGGAGTRMPVEDVGCFFDGYGIAGEAGDMIQLEAEGGNVRIAGIDYTNRVLILSAPLTWGGGQGVHLPYSGRRPDIGAYEFGLAGAADTPAPGSPRGSMQMR